MISSIDASSYDGTAHGCLGNSKLEYPKLWILWDSVPGIHLPLDINFVFKSFVIQRSLESRSIGQVSAVLH